MLALTSTKKYSEQLKEFIFLGFINRTNISGWRSNMNFSEATFAIRKSQMRKFVRRNSRFPCGYTLNIHVCVKGLDEIKLKIHNDLLKQLSNE